MLHVLFYKYASKKHMKYVSPPSFFTCGSLNHNILISLDISTTLHWFFFQRLWASVASCFDMKFIILTYVVGFVTCFQSTHWWLRSRSRVSSIPMKTACFLFSLYNCLIMLICWGRLCWQSTLWSFRGERLGINTETEFKFVNLL